MAISELTAISPVDGRYREKTEVLSGYFSEFALMNYRVMVEAEYFIALASIPLPQIPKLSAKKEEEIRSFYTGFTASDAKRIKEIEKKTRHDVKAVEYFLKEKFEKCGLSASKEFIHFGLTSQDINNTSIPYAYFNCLNDYLLPLLKEVEKELLKMAKSSIKQPMLSHTHGQPASPTTLGKELLVFSTRLSEQVKSLRAIPATCKFGGATGNFNAHRVAFPEINWPSFADQFTQKILGLQRQKVTTQIEHYDHLASTFHALSRINTILIDFSRDMWSYISMSYFHQKVESSEVGSSAMPHKVNPIDFENAEGNLGFANAIFGYLASKLPVSRLQRDLTDSTVLRNIGLPLAHCVIAWKSLLTGMSRLKVNKKKLESDLESNWSVVSEAIQSILRREGYPNPYELLTSATRTGAASDKNALHKVIDSLKIPEKLKKELKSITPSSYTGYAANSR